MSSEQLTIMQFTPTSSFVQPSFWNKFCDLKVNVDKLNQSARKIWGFYSNTSAWTTHVLEVDSTSFNTNLEDRGIPFHGKIFNKNTIEQFKECDKNELINLEGKELVDNILSGKVLERPSLLNTFFILSFGDLKKYHFYYWFAFPVPHNLKLTLEQIIPVSEELPLQDQMHLLESYKKLDTHQKSYFLIHNLHVYSFIAKLQEINEDNYQHFYFALSDYTLGENCPKPQLKNYVMFLLHHCSFLGGKTVKFLSISLDRKLSSLQGSLYKVTLPITAAESLTIEGQNLWAGWEKNEKNKFAPRFSNMRSTMEPAILYEESVDLNLRLMKWRLLPDVDLQKIKHLKCLLLGAGTLGCSVARTLLGWGVRNINFVDNSTVSYSNPVRQSLYTYEDAIESKLKADAATDALKKILPSVNSRGYNLSIPMPGHTVDATSMSSVAEAVEELKKLIQEHDVVFLLTDSRESRWLPTLISKFYGKIIINVALGFDTYLIMRYGGNSCAGGKRDITVPEGFKAISGEDLGCYFCNDVTAPGNSLKDRTLDQQCTVTRPGISSIAGAMAVELMISITQHKYGIDAPAFYKLHSASSASEPDEIMSSNVEDNQSILGVLPHSIRGFLTNFTHIFPATPRYDQCIACSSRVLEEFKEKDFDFLCNAFNIPKYLEDLTGLSKLLEDANFDDVIEIDDDDDWAT